MIKVAFVRGKFLNNFEGQNYIIKDKGISLTAFSSLFPIHTNYSFKTIKLPSLSDLLFEQLVRFVSNRTIGDSQILFGLEKYADKFDIFHTADSHYYYSYQLAKLRFSGKIKTLISTSWETIPFNNESVARKKFIKKFTQNQVDLFICYTDQAKRCLIKEGVPADKIRAVKLGVDIKRFRPSGGKQKSKVNVLFVGRQVPEKGLDDLKKAIRQLKTKNFKLQIVSDSTYEKIPEIYRGADILVVPSKKTKTWEEQYGMVLIEAMASGLPIIAYDTGAIREVVADAGILIKQDIDQLAKALKRLVLDQDMRLKLGRIGRKRAAKYFDSRKTAQELTKIYETISSNTNKRRKKSR